MLPELQSAPKIQMISEGARNALSLGGTMLGYYPVRVLPSKTAIAPVNPTFLPQSEDEREMCAIYCANIDTKVVLLLNVFKILNNQNLILNYQIIRCLRVWKILII